MKDQILAIVNRLLEDVAEKPERLVRAQELAAEQIGDIFREEALEAKFNAEMRDLYK